MINLEEVLRKKKMTKAGLAAKMGKSKQLISTIADNPRLSTMEAIAEALDMPVYRLLISEKELDELSAVNLKTLNAVEEALGLSKGELIQDPQKTDIIAEVVGKVEKVLGLKPNSLFTSADTLDQMLATNLGKAQ